MSKVLKASSDDLAGFDAVVSGAEALLSGMGYVLNAAGSSVMVKPPKRNATAAPPTCAPYDFTCTEPKQEATGNSTDEEETVELDEESSKVCGYVFCPPIVDHVIVPQRIVSFKCRPNHVHMFYRRKRKGTFP